MFFNATFTTYRRETSGSARQYAAAATITDADGLLLPAGPELKASLGVELASKAYVLKTYESDFKYNDRVVIDSVNYYVQAFEEINTNAAEYTEVLIAKDN